MVTKILKYGKGYLNLGTVESNVVKHLLATGAKPLKYTQDKKAVIFSDEDIERGFNEVHGWTFIKSKDGLTIEVKE